MVVSQPGQTVSPHLCPGGLVRTPSDWNPVYEDQIRFPETASPEMLQMLLHSLYLFKGRPSVPALEWTREQSQARAFREGWEAGHPHWGGAVGDGGALGDLWSPESQVQRKDKHAPLPPAVSQWGQ